MVYYSLLHYQAHLYLETEKSTVQTDRLGSSSLSHIVLRSEFTLVAGVPKFMKKRGSENNSYVHSASK